MCIAALKVHNSEISRLVLTLADRGLRIAEIDDLMKQALLEWDACQRFREVLDFGIADGHGHGYGEQWKHSFRDATVYGYAKTQCQTQREKTMPTGNNGLADFLGILSVLVLVAANGFFVAAEFSLVAVRRSRVAELAAAGRLNAAALQRAVHNLDALLICGTN